MRPGYAPGMHACGALLGRLRSLVLGVVLLSSIGSCQLPKPPVPKIGAAPVEHIAALIAAAGTRLAAEEAPLPPTHGSGVANGS